MFNINQCDSCSGVPLEPAIMEEQRETNKEVSSSSEDKEA